MSHTDDQAAPTPSTTATSHEESHPSEIKVTHRATEKKRRKLIKETIDELGELTLSGRRLLASVTSDMGMGSEAHTHSPSSTRLPSGPPPDDQGGLGGMGKGSRKGPTKAEILLDTVQHVKDLHAQLAILSSHLRVAEDNAARLYRTNTQLLSEIQVTQSNNTRLTHLMQNLMAHNPSLNGPSPDALASVSSNPDPNDRTEPHAIPQPDPTLPTRPPLSLSPPVGLASAYSDSDLGPASSAPLSLPPPLSLRSSDSRPAHLRHHRSYSQPIYPDEFLYQSSPTASGNTLSSSTSATNPQDASRLRPLSLQLRSPNSSSEPKPRSASFTPRKRKRPFATQSSPRSSSPSSDHDPDDEFNLNNLDLDFTFQINVPQIPENPLDSLAPMALQDQGQPPPSSSSSSSSSSHPTSMSTSSTTTTSATSVSTSLPPPQHKSPSPFDPLDFLK